MSNTKHNISAGVAQVVKRLFSDDLFREEALEHPELAFEGYGLDEEEREALRNLLGRRSLFSTTVGPLAFW